MNSDVTFSENFDDGNDTQVIGTGWSKMNAEQRATVWICEGLTVDLVEWFYLTVDCSK